MTESNDRRRISVRLVRQGPDEDEFDRRFWREQGPKARVEALWEMVLDAAEWKGEGRDQPRLQRSVVQLRRR